MIKKKCVVHLVWGFTLHLRHPTTICFTLLTIPWMCRSSWFRPDTVPECMMGATLTARTCTGPSQGHGASAPSLGVSLEGAITCHLVHGSKVHNWNTRNHLVMLQGHDDLRWTTLSRWCGSQNCRNCRKHTSTGGHSTSIKDVDFQRPYQRWSH